ncbi:acyl-CoA carboxylase epsilon subunit [Streptomyces sp. NBC_01506]|uniref:acyl-CoA carboxylase epsilon subunit n=1 Tax=Streptomyces sp. NBC_01506 TaxID=2903887 RepID=UPI00386CBA8D
MGRVEGVPVVVRVERGRAGAEELAALAAVLLAVRARGRAGAGPGFRRGGGVLPGWGWWERAGGYVAPGSWR